MRYYEIKITDPSGSVLSTDPTSGRLVPSTTAQTTYQSHVNGVLDPGALGVEFDIPLAPFANPQGGAHIRIWGISLSALSQASDLNPVSTKNYGIAVYGGMQAPFDLNKYAKPGLLASGIIFQSFGVWQGVDQHLDLVMYAGTTFPGMQANLTLNWKKGQTLSEALVACIQGSFPNVTIKANIQSIVANSDQQGTYSSIAALASHIQDITNSYFGPSYPGVNIYSNGQYVAIYDTATGTNTQADPIQLQFEDLIGQPTWISPFQVSFAAVMRSDIGVGDWIQFPAGLYPPYVLATAGAAYPGAGPSIKSAFQGVFVIKEVHHYGNFRDSDAAAWASVYVAAYASGDSIQISGHSVLPANLS